MKDIFVFWISVFLIVALLFIFNGCSEKTVYLDRVVEVKVPVRCITKDVKSAVKGTNDAVTLADIIREKKELREANEACR